MDVVTRNGVQAASALSTAESEEMMGPTGQFTSRSKLSGPRFEFAETRFPPDTVLRRRGRAESLVDKAVWMYSQGGLGDRTFRSVQWGRSRNR